MSPKAFREGSFLRAWRLMIALLLFAAWPAWASSPFYLTVERSFSEREQPEVRLDYVKSQGALVVRLLKPNDVDGFLAGQLQISRSYEEPRAALNPGHFVWKGVNRIDNPFFRLRSMFSVDFLKRAGPGFRGSLKSTAHRATVLVPDAFVVRPPAGFAVLQELHVDLQRGGEKRKDQVPGFEDDAFGDSGYEQRSLRFDALPGGLYLVQAVRGRVEAQALLQVSELGVQVKQSSRELVVRVVDRDLEPVEDASVRLRDAQGRWTKLPEKTDSQGQILHRAEAIDGRLVVEVKDSRGRTAFVDTEFLPTAQVNPGVFLFTDRPIVKPGEEFFFKGVVRANEQGRLVTPPLARAGQPVSLRLADETGKVVSEGSNGNVSAHGSFSGSFALDEKTPPGLYRVNAVVGGVTHSGEVRVRDYVKPTFYLKIVREEGLLRAGHTFRARVQALRYAGGAARDARLEYFVYRKKFEAPQWVDDAGGGLATGSDYGGETRSAASVNQPQRLFSSAEARMSALQSATASAGEEGQEAPVAGGPFEGSWKTAAAFDAEGFADIEIPLPEIADGGKEEWVYTLMVKALDAQGAQAVLSRNFNVTLSEVVGRVAFSRVLVEEGARDVELGVRASSPDGSPLPAVEGKVLLVREAASGKSENYGEVAFKTNDGGKALVKLPRLSDVGRIVARARLETFGGQKLKVPYETEPAQILVAGGASEPVFDNSGLELVAEREVLSPGEKTRIAVLLPRGWGDGEKGIAWVTLAQDRVLGTGARELKGRMAWFEVEAKPEYGTGFYYTLTLARRDGRFEERTLAFRVVQDSHLLGIDVRPEKTVAEPMKPVRIRFQVKRSDGSPAADAELAVSVVDRAVYAVQAEFRPRIAEFFFPLPRLNLMTFHSDELQGYGYADEIRRPNFRLQAIKPQTTLLTRGFRDTAAWIPHLQTDAQGMAEMSFEMPANLTEWVVTAVAIDNAGRVGEATGQFRTSADVVATAAFSQFLRKGDEIRGSLRIANGSENAAKVRLSVEAPGPLSAAGVPAEPVAVAGKSEFVSPVSLRAAGDAGEAALRVSAVADKGLHVGGTGEFPLLLLPSGLLELLSTRPAPLGQSRIQAALPSRGVVKEVAVQAYYGLLGAALQATSRLVVYPYGCTEQLVHSTIPNLVVLDLLDKTGIKGERLGPYRETLEKARNHASFGIKKLLVNQKPSGGFGMWPGDAQASSGVTLVALEALTIAAELGFKEADLAAERAREFVRAREEHEKTRGLELALLTAARAETNAAWPGWYENWEKHLALSERSGFAEMTYSLAYLNALQRVHPDAKAAKESLSVRSKVASLLAESLSKFNPEEFRASRRALFVEGGELAASDLGFVPGVASVVATAARALWDAKALSGGLEARVRTLLLDEMQEGYWLSTYDSAKVIFALRPLLANEARSLRDGPRRLEVRGRDGSLLGHVESMPGGYAGHIDGSNGDVGNFLEIAVRGLPSEARAEAQFRLEVPLEDVKPAVRGIALERDLFVTGAKGARRVGESLKVGDVVISKVRVSRTLPEMGFFPSRYVVIDDPVPAFAEAMEDESIALADAGAARKADSLAQVAQILRYPEKVVRVVRVWSWASQEFASAWQVRYPGRAALPAASAFDMYDERIRGNSAARMLDAEP